MTGFQDNYEIMSLARLALMNANPTITALMPNASVYIATIQTTHASITPLKVLQEADKGVYTVNKNLLRAGLLTQALDFQCRIVAYATNVNNASLLKLLDYSESELKKCSDQKFATICQLIRDNANANVTALTAYGVTAANITSFQTNITNFNAALPKERTAETGSGEATRMMAVHFKTLKTNWAKIDKLMEMVKTSHPGFYSEDLRTRKVQKNRKNKQSLIIKASNADTKLPEPKVKVTIIASGELLKTLNGKSNTVLNGQGVLVKKTAERGGSTIQNLPDGSYTFTAEKTGFKLVKGSLNIVNGETTRLDIVMGKE